jgi:hypothetical protein
MRTRAENEQAEAAMAHRRADSAWRAYLKAQYHVSGQALDVLMNGGDRACLCGRACIAGDGRCLFCEQDETDLGREYTEAEVAAIRAQKEPEE